MSYKIGLMDENVVKLKGRPKVFMSRLKETMIKQGIYSSDSFDKWINLSFRKIPNYVLDKKGKVEITVRFDGVWSDSLIPYFIFSKVAYNIDTLVFKFLNKIILDNYKIADKIIYQSEFSKFTVEELLFDRFKIDIPKKENIIIYNGVDLNKFKPMKNLRNINNFPNILISHRLIPFKRAHQAPMIIEKLKKNFPKLKVHVVGEGIKNPYYFNEDTKEHFIKEIQKKKLDSYFEFYGHINPNDLAKVYNKCDFMLNLSYADPCPNVVVEAIACGLPVIAPNSGGIPELVEDKDLLIDENINMKDFQPRFIYRDLPIINPDNYVKKIINMVDNINYFSDKMRARAEEKFNINGVGEKYIDFVCK